MAGPQRPSTSSDISNDPGVTGGIAVARNDPPQNLAREDAIPLSPVGLSAGALEASIGPASIGGQRSSGGRALSPPPLPPGTLNTSSARGQDPSDRSCSGNASQTQHKPSLPPLPPPYTLSTLPDDVAHPDHSGYDGSIPKPSQGGVDQPESDKGASATMTTSPDPRSNEIVPTGPETIDSVAAKQSKGSVSTAPGANVTTTSVAEGWVDNKPMQIEVEEPKPAQLESSGSPQAAKEAPPEGESLQRQILDTVS